MNHNEFFFSNMFNLFFSVRSSVFGLIRSFIGCIIMFALFLILLKKVNEPVHNNIMLRINNYTQSVLELLPGNIRVLFPKLFAISIHNFKFVAQNTISTFQMLYKSLINSYTFLSTDPNVELFLNLVVNNFLSLYIKICEYVSMFFTNITQIQIT